MIMKLLKSMVFAAVALSTTAAFAKDGSERASQAAHNMRIAQEVRFNEQNRNETSPLVSVEKTSRAEQMKKSEG
ncbi:hypothetical protein PSCICM_27540 [Pseudomonas cichorii]|uniref:Secreted protein n=2 Tax=Pseudomonas TaxID=286 RepID=A0A3M4WBH3_PSECI|nr:MULTISPECIES: hypothetical protein [Pseudomonas]AHF67801.1 hypothetical protein PCH70_26480 [Pseudomonas cichorii JBC1]QVE14884.1 hypothetical protein KGD89_13180 [Pseudomonas cichorii]RMR60959.1 hypothetical protein ALP84_01575 [Pseudomonas cichorii]GFM76935.1 hypothetical protein PSCICM_27540 [Pseudomonas cichorii]GFM94001.1 hypothetical protein PSCICP_39730 [Pseudomonas cichorii]